MLIFRDTDVAKTMEENDCTGSEVELQHLQNEIQKLQNLQEIQKLTTGINIENLSAIDMENLHQNLFQLRAANEAGLIGNSYSLVEDYEHKKLMATKGKKKMTYTKDQWKMLLYFKKNCIAWKYLKL